MCELRWLYSRTQNDDFAISRKAWAGMASACPSATSKCVANSWRSASRMSGILLRGTITNPVRYTFVMGGESIPTTMRRGKFQLSTRNRVRGARPPPLSPKNDPDAAFRGAQLF